MVKLEQILEEEELKKENFIPLKIQNNDYYIKLFDKQPEEVLLIYKKHDDHYEIHHIFEERKGIERKEDTI